MTLQEVYSLLLSSGYPVAYRDYTGEVKKEIPKPPFMVYSVLSGDFDGGDMRNRLHKLPVFRKMSKLQQVSKLVTGFVVHFDGFNTILRVRFHSPALAV